MINGSLFHFEKIIILLSLLTGATVTKSLPEKVLVAPVPCTMSNGKPRPYPCEFAIQTVWFMGKNGNVVGKITPGNTSVKLPKSKADSSFTSTAGESFIYTVAVDFRRINVPAFPKKEVTIPGLGFYTISTSTVDSPISPGELTVVRRLDVGPSLPKSGLRPVRASFKLQLNYAMSGGQPTLIAPVRYIQIANPITFTKFPSSINLYRDRAEAWITCSASVDFSK
ncbi:hypothetical protein [Spirosoma oryzicola]|uniref:hypothetical protein n=1 Tax=Spirosoma oryzicola TaxID=2898794 RepID=UPI001E2A8E10|nr:hypothetical protein [Spirosoma oryzicola]UHG93064.1 hypothetical protein LQ777_09220 [Spirosoma oryzicola]